MSNINLFQLSNKLVTELEGRSITIGKTLQSLIEKQLFEK